MSLLAQSFSAAKRWVKREAFLGPEERILAQIQRQERRNREWKAFVEDWMAGQPENPHPYKSPEWIAEEERKELAFSGYMFEQSMIGQSPSIIAFNQRVREHCRQVIASERAFWNSEEGQRHLTDPRFAFKQAWFATITGTPAHAPLRAVRSLISATVFTFKVFRHSHYSALAYNYISLAPRLHRPADPQVARLS